MRWLLQASNDLLRVQEFDSPLSPAINGRFYAIINDQGSGEDRHQQKEKRIFFFEILFFEILFKDCNYEKVNDIDWIGNVAEEPV